MTLLEVQRQMLRAISRPFIGSDPIFCDADADFIKPNSRLSPAERLEIYGRSYWFRVLDALYEDFPGLNAVLGPNVFNRLSRAYLSDCTSQSFTLRNLGSRLADWLARNPKYAGNRHAIALDMARLEWAHIEAFDNAGKRVFGPEDLTELGPDFRAVLQPHVRLLALRYLVDDLRIQVNERRITRIQASRLRRSRLFTVGSNLASIACLAPSVRDIRLRRQSAEHLATAPLRQGNSSQCLRDGSPYGRNLAGSARRETQ
jgi:hypothetical protein